MPTIKPLVFGVAGTQKSKGGGADACFEHGTTTEISVRLHQGQRYQVSLQAQASPVGTRLALMQGHWTASCSYPSTLPPPAEGCPYTGTTIHEVSLGSDWSNVSVAFDGSNCSGLQLRVSPANRFGATVWIDAVQVLVE